MFGNILLLASLVTDFATPPAACHPETWFHIYGGVIDRALVQRDVDAIAASGISGVQFFNEFFGGEPKSGKRQLRALSPEWDDAVAFLADACRAKGLRFSLQSCPGWSMAGGPWIAPSNAMRQLVFRVSDYAPGMKVLRHETAEQGSSADYRDIVTLAFPSPKDGREVWQTPLRIKGSAAVEADGLDTNSLHPKKEVAKPLSAEENRLRWEQACSTGEAKLGFAGAGEVVCELGYPKPMTMRTLELSPIATMNDLYMYAPEVTVAVAADVGGEFKTIREIALPPANWQIRMPVSLALPETTSARWRVILRHAHSLRLDSLRLYTAAYPDNWEAEAGYDLRGRIRGAAPALSSACCVDPKTIIDVSRYVRPDDTLTWRPKSGGAWTILRIGHANMMMQNAPAPEEATGWECDKLSAKAADIHYDGYVGRLNAGPLKGKLAGFLLDSWECGNQNWTDGFGERFAAANGYTLDAFWPALCGYVVGDREKTRAFYADWRRTISNEMEKNFYGRIVERAHADGLKVAYETAGGDDFSGDVLSYWKYADTPMCEFWQPRFKGRYDKFDLKAIRPCASAAHLYGKPRVEAESFTGTPREHWNLLGFKATANVHFAAGVTHNSYQGWVHDPEDLGSAGNGLGKLIGSVSTLGDDLKTLTTYLGRCTLLLERGKPVQDILLYLGDDVPHRPPETRLAPDGYKYDYCTMDAFWNRLEYKDGAWMTPDGIRYPILWLRDCPHLLPKTIAKIAEAEARGAKVVRGEKLDGLPPPDLVAEKPGLVWCHRQEADCDWYFLAPDGIDEWSGEVSLRSSGMRVSIWDVPTGTINPCSVENGRIRLALKGGDAVFVRLERE